MKVSAVFCIVAVKRPLLLLLPSWIQNLANFLKNVCACKYFLSHNGVHVYLNIDVLSGKRKNIVSLWKQLSFLSCYIAISRFT